MGENPTFTEDPIDESNLGWPPDPLGYHLTNKLGEGGMGAVYRALDQNTGQIVAVKFALRSSVLRFKREYGELVNIQHPNIIKVYGFNEQFQPPYIVMEYLQGETLSKYLKHFPAKRPPLHVAIPLLLQITEALIYLHNQGLIHRDLKPDNLMISDEHQRLNLKVMDFGLVRPVDASRPLTRQGSFIGTPGYAAPEQFADTSSVTRLADLYSLGVIMYEIVGGQRPFIGPDFEKQHSHDIPLPPSKISSNVPDLLEKLILSLLEKQPSKRLRNAELAQFALNNIPVTYPVSAQISTPSAAQVKPDVILNRRYRVEKRLGQGGYATVYKSYDLVLRQDVAVKIYADTSPEAIKQFQRETKILAGLNHSNMPRVRAYFIEGNAQYMVMDFIPGRSLAEALKAAQERLKSPIPESNLLKWANQICTALSYLHEQNPPIVHRDVKPENIIVGENDQAYLVDFGIAKIDPTLKTSTVALGITPGYAPPEQYGRTSDHTDARTDIYALGATLYHMLTGQRPSESIGIASGLESPIKPAKDINPAISLTVSLALERAMKLNPSQRPTTVKDFNNALHGRSSPLNTQKRKIQKSKEARQKFIQIGVLVGLSILLVGIMVFGITSFSLLPIPLPWGNTRTPTVSTTPTMTTTPVIILVPSLTPTYTFTPTATISAVPATMTLSPSATVTETLTNTPTFTFTPSPTPSRTPSKTPTTKIYPMTIPVFVYPHYDGQKLDPNCGYMFKVEPIAYADGFLWGFIQNGELVWENSRDEGKLGGNTYNILEGHTACSLIKPGELEVLVRAEINGEYTEAARRTVIIFIPEPEIPIVKFLYIQNDDDISFDINCKVEEIPNAVKYQWSFYQNGNSLYEMEQTTPSCFVDFAGKGTYYILPSQLIDIKPGDLDISARIQINVSGELIWTDSSTVTVKVGQ